MRVSDMRGEGQSTNAELTSHLNEKDRDHVHLQPSSLTNDADQPNPVIGLLLLASSFYDMTGVHKTYGHRESKTLGT